MNAMNEFFLKVVNMSISASCLVLAVLAVRLFLKRAPKWVNVLLWSIVALRLICPLSLESSFSLVPQPIGNETMLSGWLDDYTGAVQIIHDVSPDYEAAVAGGAEVVETGEGGHYAAAGADGVSPPPTIKSQVVPKLAGLWALGVAALLAYTAISYWQLRRKVREATLLGENIYQCEGVASPFVLGAVKPRIYLPYQIAGQDLHHVVAHERAHIRRKDHWWKPLGFLLLTVHWFNPLMWLSYVLLCRDIELACDEKVIRELGSEQRADYSQALLSCSVNRRLIAACPLAFGEVGVKERVKSVMNYRKPAFWVIAASVAACVAVAVCFLTNPAASSHLQARDHGDYLELSCQLEEPIRSFALYEDIYQDGTLVSSEAILMDNFVEEGGATPRSFSATLTASPIQKAGGGYDGALEICWENKTGTKAEWTLPLPDEHYTNYATTLADGSRNMFMELDVADNDDILLYRVLLANDPAGMIIGIDLKNGNVKGNALVVQYRLVTSTGPLSDFQKPENKDEVSIEPASPQSVQWTYSPMMSASWHAFFTVSFDLPMDIRVEASCDSGTLHNLSAAGQPSGKTMAFADGEPLCWFPAVGENPADATHQAAIDFAAYNGEELLYSGRLHITQTGSENGRSFYEATLGGTDLLSLKQESNSAKVVLSDRAAILAHTDLNRNGVTENVILSEVHPGGMLYELRVEESGQVIWSTEAAPAHAGWNTIMLYHNADGDHLVQYQPAMFQGMGSYVCTVFSLEGNQQTVKNEWTVEFSAYPAVEETAEMKQFAKEVGLLLRNCYVLLSTEQGMTVTQYTSAADLPQLYPVRFDPEEIGAAMADPTKSQALTANAAHFPEEAVELLFASGAGGWGTILHFQPDGSFSGVYEDSDMGSGLEGYPNGVRRISEFEGKFTNIQQISDYAWSMQLGELTTAQEADSTWVEDDTLYIAADPHGVAHGETFLLYAPGTPGDVLSAGCRDWWPEAFLWRRGEQESIDGWCLCNVNTGHGFFESI